MKRYLVFYGDRFYPEGGMFDFKESFDTEKEAKDFLELYEKQYFAWCHIYDLEKKEIIYDFEL